MKDKDRVDLQIEAESIPTDSKPNNGKTSKRRLYEASGLNIDPYQEMYQCGLAGIPVMVHGKRACKKFGI